MPSRRPRLLYLCALNPWRLNNGGIIRNYWLSKALAGRYDLDLVTADDAHEPVPATFAARCASVRRFPRPDGPLARPLKFVRSLRPGRTYVTSGGVTPQMTAAVASMIAARGYAAVVAELGLFDALPDRTPPLVYGAHNCEAALLARRARLEPAATRAVMTLDARRLRRYERRAIERASLVTPCSRDDLAEMREFAPAVAHKAVVIPNGVDTASYAGVAHGGTDDGLILVPGSFDWLPNQRGLLWFIDDVVPVLESLLAGRRYRIRVAGRMRAGFARAIERGSPRVSAAPNVPDMRRELRAATLVAVPVLASSGTRLRILEAWAAGRPVVSTSHGAFGLDHIPGADLLCGDSAAAFAGAIARVVTDAPLRAALRAGGLARAAAHDWSGIGAQLVSALERHGAPGPLSRKDQPASRRLG